MTKVETIEIPRRKKEANDLAPTKASQTQPDNAAKETNDIDPSTLTKEECIAKSDEFKGKANKYFAEQKYDLATELYTKAIKYYPTAILYSNRAFSNFKREYYVNALQDATISHQMDPNYIKAYYRLGSAHLALGNYNEAKKNFKELLNKEPKEKDAKIKFNLCNSLINAKLFEDAILVTSESHFGQLDLESMAVEDSYKGPRFDGEKITKEFVFEMVEYMKQQKLPHKKYVCKILKQSFEIMKSLPTLVDIDHDTTMKITVCGDTHGQYYDLLNIFEINGFPSEDKPYLFNGDFVDRGSFSFEIIICLLAFKLLYPNHMHLTRGNHESVDMNRFYGFQGEVVAKYSEMVYDLFSELFLWFPLAFVLDDSFMVVHGGLFGRDGVTLDDIRKINRHSPEGVDNDLVQCLLWSDPQSNPGVAPSSRGVGVYFGPDVTRKFLKQNNLCTIIRSHEVKEKGYQVDNDGSLITVFSAPNYCDQSGNLGSFLNFTEDTVKITTFKAVEHPNVPPMHYAKKYF
ncbi:hypothetical protein DICPUDRAFT_45625 [Dictyostelium purpureum]|uniref:Serine/threonine-protein phosphatase T n=1 Tax=Dictyostelium purpureum TaxID=5786 RepID=F0ZB54_DICPU|nr:uncharacterized protein DICPUDRAFT_45625 [Dictyostelium purpureum]EGC38861.1 hypothetical protein DICPUDRAFT_45625 [Dictyostelium purpureum]|eukprot:XP_003284655.1 hypothetical protein DICPUDRAFT_45625 [Dictyostelium purpureum]